MALFSTSNLNQVQDVLGKVDGILTAIEKYPNGSCVNSTLTVNPFELLLLLLKQFGVTEDDLIKWLVSILKYTLPTIELGVKGILLANLKEMIDCNIDPRIPAYAREGEELNIDGEEIHSGITIPLSAVDCKGKLSTNPMSVPTNPLFFGIKNAESPYDFLRPRDFDAFLWLVVHRKFPASSTISGLDDLRTNYKANSVTGNSLLDIVEMQYTDENSVGILQGSTFREMVGGDLLSTISVCKSADRDPYTNKIIKNTLYPIGSNYDRITWYGNRKCYFNFMSPKRSNDENRNYNEDIGICTFKYVDDISDNTMISDDTVYLKNNINIKILRRPEVHVPHLGQNILIPKKLLFNKDGVADSNGRFTVKILSSDYDFGNGIMRYRVASANNTATLIVNKNGEYHIESPFPQAYLYECYPNLTVYEFNYDYIFSMRLLDAKVVATQLIENISKLKLGLRLNVDSDFSQNEILGHNQIVEIVKKIVEGNDYEVSDCFFTFSNEEIDKMTREAELQRANDIPFGYGATNVNDTELDQIYDILDAFEDSATLEESVDVFKNLMNQVSVTIQPETKDRVNNNFGFNTKIGLAIVQEFIKNLVMVVVDALLSPKVLIMIALNQKLCGKLSYEKCNSTMDWLMQMTGLITSIVKEIRDLILGMLLEFTMKKITELLIKLNTSLVIEQLMVYRSIIKQLLEACSFGGGSLIPTELDKVDYADIDANDNQPTTDKC